MIIRVNCAHKRPFLISTHETVLTSDEMKTDAHALAGILMNRLPADTFDTLLSILNEMDAVTKNLAENKTYQRCNEAMKEREVK